jgi:hypothetical protein
MLNAPPRAELICTPGRPGGLMNHRPALETCIRLDPRGPSLVNRLNQVTLAHYFCRDYEASIEAAQRATLARFSSVPTGSRK